MEARAFDQTTDLPSGTVTFLFTDVEGSTRLLRELGAEGYAAALAEHRGLIRQACAGHGGVEVDTQGDAFFFAFPTATGALAAARDLTDGLATGPIRVRVGLHTGTPLLSGEGYVGEDVHLAARIAAAAHGGQVVCSTATASAVEPRGTARHVELLELGKHRLKDITEPVTIYQLGTGSFPALKAIASSNLPTPASSFVGRERELAEADGLLRETRLLTVAGPGGAGKTRFALELARRARDERFGSYPDGVYVCFLASLRDPELVLPTVAGTLSLREEPGMSALELLCQSLEDKRLLLLLDNLEHLLAATPGLVTLLECCSGLTLLCTSRERLRLRGERGFLLPPLEAEDAVSLFCERAGSEPSPAIGELSERLEGLPLAIELAAARMDLLSPEQLLDRLAGRLDLLKGGGDADPRQQTLRATIEWSFDLLSAEEQRVFRALSIFAGGCTLEAAEKICGAGLDTLESLLDKSLLRRTSDRLWMLETIAEYARERLDGSEEAEQVRNAHAAWFSAFAAHAELRGPEHALWLKRLRAEHANLRTALAWLGERRRSAEELGLACDLAEYAYHSGALLEGRRWLDDALARADGAPPELRALTLAFSGLCAFFQGDLDIAERRTEAGLELARASDDPRTLAEALRARHLVLGHEGDKESVDELGNEALEVSRANGLDALVADLANNMGYDALQRGDLERAGALLSESVEAGRAGDDTIVLSASLSNLALVDFERGAYELAAERWTGALRFAREDSLGPLSLAALAGVEALMAHAGALTLSARIHGSIDRLLAETGERMQGVERRLRDVAFAGAREALGASETEHAVSAGRDLETDTAAQEALLWLEAFAAK